MRVIEQPNAKAALLYLLMRPQGVAPADAAVECRLVSNDILNQYLSGNEGKFGDPGYVELLRNEGDCYEVQYVYRDSAGLLTEDCIGAVVLHDRAGKAHAVW